MEDVDYYGKVLHYGQNEQRSKGDTVTKWWVTLPGQGSHIKRQDHIKPEMQVSESYGVEYKKSDYKKSESKSDGYKQQKFKPDDYKKSNYKPFYDYKKTGYKSDDYMKFDHKKSDYQSNDSNHAPRIDSISLADYEKFENQSDVCSHYHVPQNDGANRRASESAPSFLFKRASSLHPDSIEIIVKGLDKGVSDYRDTSNLHTKVVKPNFYFIREYIQLGVNE